LEGPPRCGGGTTAAPSALWTSTLLKAHELSLLESPPRIKRRLNNALAEQPTVKDALENSPEKCP
jgi:hypothetical protein